MLRVLCGTLWNSESHLYIHEEVWLLDIRLPLFRVKGFGIGPMLTTH